MQNDYTCKNNLDKPESLPWCYDTALFMQYLKPNVNIHLYHRLQDLLSCVFQLRNLIWCNGSSFQGSHIHVTVDLWEGTFQCYWKDHSWWIQTANKAILPGREPWQASRVSAQLGQTPHSYTSDVEYTELILHQWAGISGAQEVVFILLFNYNRIPRMHTSILRATFDL